MYAITVKDSNPQGLYCSRCFTEISDFARMQLLSEIRINLCALLLPFLDKFPDFTRMQLLSEIRIHLELYCSRCFKFLRDSAMQLLSEIRIHLRRLECSRCFPDMTRYCKYAITI
ncbi:hypothetical protein CEXT_403311 [Caerostris extrusa]|uniref:Uncharacterized protein n=1 Tax=Caerostris extrusa TaxID=172846 RepID=A0AAV4TIH0_CAEEX|nr:hypothetical protein CEXT_403311 [Caerostris extrusa]